MPSIKGDGPRQLPIPQAPRFDAYGMHATDCECVRCEMGMRPTDQERWIARQSWERAQQRKLDEEARSAAGLSKVAEKKKRLAAAARERRAYTDQLIAKLSKPVERPATPDELAEMRRQFPNLGRKPK